MSNRLIIGRYAGSNPRRPTKTLETAVKYKSGLYRYKSGLGKEQRVILYIDGDWYLAGWECPLELSDVESPSTVLASNIGELICEIEDE